MFFRSKYFKTTQGFTLAELLVALAILGEIAAFTIPKILNAQQTSSYNTKAKEAVAMISQAYQLYQLETGANSTTKMADFTHYLNYVSVDSTSTIDYGYTYTTFSCSGANFACLKLHSGATLHYRKSEGFNGTNTTNAILFSVDPDGTTDGTTNGPGKAAYFLLYYNGRIQDRGSHEPNSQSTLGTYNPSPGEIPPWFSW